MSARGQEQDNRSDSPTKLWNAVHELRAIGSAGLYWEGSDWYAKERYERVLKVAANLASLLDRREPLELERVFNKALEHMSPSLGGSAAVFHQSGRILLIQRMDDKRWALPGGMINVGESPSAGTRREVLEETGIEIECDYLVGVYDWMLAGWPGFPGQLHSYIFSAHPVHPEAQPTRSNETLDARWFARNDLPPLSPAHDMALGHAIEFVDRKRSAPYFN